MLMHTQAAQRKEEIARRGVPVKMVLSTYLMEKVHAVGGREASARSRHAALATSFAPNVEKVEFFRESWLLCSRAGEAS